MLNITYMYIAVAKLKYKNTAVNVEFWYGKGYHILRIIESSGTLSSIFQANNQQNRHCFRKLLSNGHFLHTICFASTLITFSLRLQLTTFVQTTCSCPSMNLLKMCDKWLIDWLIKWLVVVKRGNYFMHIQEENKLSNNKSSKG